MTSPARRAEADRVELVYYWALQQLGNALAVDALDIWAQVPASTEAARSAWWLARVIDLLFGFRSEAHDLAVSYYRLVRALRTGATAATGTETEGDTVSLNDLRDNFEEIVDHIEAETGDVPQVDLGGAPDDLMDEPPLELGDDNDVIEVEDIGDIGALIDDSNEAALEEAGLVLDALGTDNLLKKLEEIDKGGTLTAEEAHALAGNRGAAAAVRIMQNAARGLVYDMADTDARVLGYARFSTTGEPCGWCAMLIARGPVYKSAASAAAQERDGARRIDLETSQALSEADKYHDNCRCVAVPIFAVDQYDSPIYRQSRELRALYDSLKKLSTEERNRLYGTTDLLAILRKVMRDATGESTTTSALAA